MKNKSVSKNSSREKELSEKDHRGSLLYITGTASSAGRIEAFAELRHL